MPEFSINPDSFNPRIYYMSFEKYTAVSSPQYHFHSFPVIMYVLDVKGTCKYRIEDRIHNVSKGCIVLLNPGVFHEKIIPSGSEIRELHLAFDNISIKGFPRNSLVKPASYAITNMGASEDDFSRCINEA